MDVDNYITNFRTILDVTDDYVLNRKLIRGNYNVQRYLQHLRFKVRNTELWLTRPNVTVKLYFSEEKLPHLWFMDNHIETTVNKLKFIVREFGDHILEEYDGIPITQTDIPVKL